MEQAPASGFRTFTPEAPAGLGILNPDRTADEANIESHRD
jgi:hypothetical protein